MNETLQLQESEIIPEIQRLSYEVVIECLKGRMTTAQAAKLLCVSTNTIRARIRRFKKKGIRAFYHGNIGKKRGMLSEEQIDMIADLYKSRYKGLSYSAYLEVLRKEHNMFFSRNVLVKALKSRGIVSPDRAMHLRTSKNSVEDIEAIISYIKPYMDRTDSLLPVEELGCIYCCDRLCELSRQALKKQIYNITNELPRTNIDVFDKANKLGLIDDPASWNYWLEQHKYFSAVHLDADVRRKVMYEIRSLYFPMILNVYEKIKESLPLT